MPLVKSDATVAAPQLPVFVGKAAENLTVASNTVKVKMADKIDGRITGGVAHDAAAITAAMSAMKTEDEVKVLFTNLYQHILKTVLES